MSETLKRKTVKGTIWSTIERFSVQAVSFIVMILMARVLTPADYGLVGMVTIFIAVSQSLVDSGFSQALIWKQDRTEVDNSTVFWFNIGVGIILYAALFFCAPLIARFYDQPLLIPITRLISLSVLINSFVVVQRALLTIKIDFKTQAKASLIASIISGGLGIGLAYGGSGVWAIVWYQISNLTLNILLLWYFAKWRPRIVFSWGSFKLLFGYGSKLAVSGIIDTLYRNIYLIVIGKIFKAAELGNYTRAQQFASFPSSNINGIIQRVTFPILCTIQDDDVRLANVYRKFLRLSGFIIFPMMFGLAVLSKPLVLVVLNPQWEFSATLLSILCFAMMWYPIHSINLNLLQVKGRSDLFLRLEIWKKVIGVAILCVTVPFGLIWMCVGSIFSSIISLIINTYYTQKLINVGFLAQMRDLLPTLLYSTIMSGVIILAVYWLDKEWLKLVVGTTAGIIAYFLMAKMTDSADLKSLMELRKR